MADSRCRARSRRVAGILLLTAGCGGHGGTPDSSGSTISDSAAHLAARVYARDGGTVYTPDGPFGVTPVAGAAVQVGSTVVATTAADGTATGTTSQTGYVTFSVTAAGFLPTVVSEEIDPGSKHALDFGLYAVPAMSPRPGFVKGITLWDAGGWTKSVFLKNGSLVSTITRVRDKAGAGVVAFSDTADAQGGSAETLEMTADAGGGYWGMLSEADYATVVGAAHASGIAYMMMLSVYSTDAAYSSAIWNVSASDTAFWDRWFAQYTPIVARYATTARNLGVEYLSVGLNLGYASRTSVSRWRTLVDAVRQTGYRGEIGYFGYTDPTRGYYENHSYPAGFLDLFDFVGASVYAVTSTAHPTREELVAGWRSLESSLPSNRRVLVLIGTPSTDRGASDPTYIEPLRAANPVADGYRRDDFQQADVYEAALETFGSPEGGSRVAGLLSWGYSYQDNYRDVVQPGDVAFDKSASVRNKPAEAVLRWWFEHL